MQWLLRKLVVYPDFGSIILFTDEICYTRDGVFKSHNNYIRDDHNSYTLQVRVYTPKFASNLWTGIAENCLNGPYLLPPRQTGHVYLQFLENVPFDIGRIKWFVHDGTPEHFKAHIPLYLN